MESALLGVVLDSSVLVFAERKKLKTPELVHGIYRADSVDRARQRRQFLDELKFHIPIHPVTETTAEIIGRIGGEQASKGVNLPLADLIIGASAIEIDYAVATNNVRDFGRIPDLIVKKF
jgi:predicted nucleic acid-binding protein